ncbi:hypothetical protein B0H17DRAFT_1149055 [Mycena rosella]|uniref:Uncharacterized protein n=1 Tax=Mycena rosella TaxID=1033263 RepID=A0AAD7C6I6_MYCRO|nr:hypothetical protein B0H17DRAFT_1149055 [Mycena rosella]
MPLCKPFFPSPLLHSLLLYIPSPSAFLLIVDTTHLAFRPDLIPITLIITFSHHPRSSFRSPAPPDNCLPQACRFQVQPPIRTEFRLTRMLTPFSGVPQTGLQAPVSSFKVKALTVLFHIWSSRDQDDTTLSSHISYMSAVLHAALNFDSMFKIPKTGMSQLNVARTHHTLCSIAYSYLTTYTHLMVLHAHVKRVGSVQCCPQYFLPYLEFPQPSSDTLLFHLNAYTGSQSCAHISHVLAVRQAAHRCQTQVRGLVLRLRVPAVRSAAPQLFARFFDVPRVGQYSGIVGKIEKAL